jgi:hypothetical protein
MKSLHSTVESTEIEHRPMRTEYMEKPARMGHPEFAPLEMARAEELKRLINLAARSKEGVVIDPAGGGINDTVEVGLISPEQNTNALVRFQRHYAARRPAA